MLNSVEFIPVRITNISGMGDVLVYNVKYPNGNYYSGGMISLDMKWMKPCTMGDNLNKWCEVLSGNYFENHFMIRESSNSLRQIEIELIKLVKDVIFERTVLGEVGALNAKS